MRFRFMRFRFIVLALMAALAASPALAQQVAPPDKPDGKWIEPPKKLPQVKKSDPRQSLDSLFEALKVAPDAIIAKSIEERIWAQWVMSRSDTANLLMVRVKTAVDAEDYDLAIKLLDAVVAIKPDYIEAWNRRATIHYLQKQYGRSLEDIREVLRREPRHFGALTGAGLILREIGEEKRALDAFRRALAIHPNLEQIPDMVKSLTEKVEGRDI